MIHRIIGAFIAIGLSSATARAADAPAPIMPLSPETFVGGAAMPDREHALLDIFRDTAARYQAARTAKQKGDLRIAMEVRLARFMDESQEAKDWLGVVRAAHSTAEGDRWISIEIAPETALSTFENRFADKQELTLIRKYTPLWSVIDQIAVGQVVTFSATMLVFDVSDNDDMVLRPHLVARFSALKPME